MENREHGQSELKGGMENGENEKIEPRNEIVAIYSDFMIRVSQFDELVSTGIRLLSGFQQAIGFLRRPPVDKTSNLVEGIIKAHGSKRVLSYVEAGCTKYCDSSLNVSKCKIIMDELECIMDDAAYTVQIANEKDDIKYSSDSFSSSHEEEVPSSELSEPEDFGAAMSVVYSMVKQDYMMQVKIVTSLSPKSSLGELDTYCQMWSLRPFVDDDVMHKAWSLCPISVLKAQ